MGYIPTEWETGDVITAEKLNKAENGIAGAGPYIVQIDSYDPETSDAILDASFEDVYNAVSAGRLVMMQDEQTTKNVSISFLMGTSYNPAENVLYPYDVTFFDKTNTYTYHAANETDSLVQYQV